MNYPEGKLILIVALLNSRAAKNYNANKNYSSNHLSNIIFLVLEYALEVKV